MKKNKEKINPIVKNQKEIKKMKVNKSDNTEDENSIRTLIIIVIVIAVLIGIIYGVTELLKKDPKVEEEITAGTINYDKTTVGTILNRPYDEYYVLVYNTEDSDAVLYSTILTKYMQNSKDKDYTKIYFCDLDNKLNAPYYNVGNDNKSNKKVNKAEDFDFSDLTLLKIEKGKVTQYIEELDKIKDILK